MAFLRKIPGFRSNRPWKMTIASLFYFFMLLVILAGIFGSPEETAQNSLTEDIQGSIIESNDTTAEEAPGQPADAPVPEPSLPAQEDTPEKQAPVPQLHNQPAL